MNILDLFDIRFSNTYLVWMMNFFCINKWFCNKTKHFPKHFLSFTESKESKIIIQICSQTETVDSLTVQTGMNWALFQQRSYVWYSVTEIFVLSRPPYAFQTLFFHILSLFNVRRKGVYAPHTHAMAYTNIDNGMYCECAYCVIFMCWLDNNFIKRMLTQMFCRMFGIPSSLRNIIRFCWNVKLKSNVASTGFLQS